MILQRIRVDWNVGIHHEEFRRLKKFQSLPDFG